MTANLIPARTLVVRIIAAILRLVILPIEHETVADQNSEIKIHVLQVLENMNQFEWNFHMT